MVWYSNDTKIYSDIRSENDIYQLQQDIDKLLRWSEKWQIPLNIFKCKSLHIGRSNPNHIYSMAACIIKQAVEERDLGILIDNQLKFHDHLIMIIGKARSLLGLYQRIFH